jgi:hypothetical protein
MKKIFALATMLASAALLFAGTGSKSQLSSKQPRTDKARCSKTFPGTIPQCGNGGGTSGGGTSGSGGSPYP